MKSLLLIAAGITLVILVASGFSKAGKTEKSESGIQFHKGTRIKVIPYDQATGRLKEIYDELIIKRGKLAEVHTIQSLHPESIVKRIDLYLEIMFSKSELSRAEREMMAVVVSVANGCEYCRFTTLKLYRIIGRMKTRWLC